MTKKDYIVIANAIRENRNAILYNTEITRLGIYRLVVDSLANKLKLDNPSFNYEKFFEACGLDVQW